MPFGRLSIQSLQCADGAIVGVDIKQPLQVRVPIDGVSAQKNGFNECEPEEEWLQSG